MPKNGKHVRVGLIMDPEFVIFDRSVCALTPALIRAICGHFDVRLIYNQSLYDKYCTEVDLLLSLEPGWAAPRLKWKRMGRLKRGRVRVPTYVAMSDPHANLWREEYVLENEIDGILGYYYHPFVHHFRQVDSSRILHFPWAIPDAWLRDLQVCDKGTSDIMIFGASGHRAYEVRNWCRALPFVKDANLSGCTNKHLSDDEFFRALSIYDAGIAAGSEHPDFGLTFPKYFEIAASGALLFAHQTKDLDLLGFESGVNCLVFTQDTFEELAQSYLADRTNPVWLKIRGAGQNLIRERHLISHRLDLIERLAQGMADVHA